MEGDSEREVERESERKRAGGRDLYHNCKMTFTTVTIYCVTVVNVTVVKSSTEISIK